LYASGDGNDIISDTTSASWHSAQTDILMLNDLTVSGLEFSRSSWDLLIKVLNTGEVIRIVNQFYQSASTAGTGMELIRFADGEQWSRETIYGAVTAGGFIPGTRFNDTLTGGSIKESLYGEAGNDTLDGQGGSDLLYGGIGNDTLLVSQSAAGEVDTLNGGAGIDTANFEGFTSAVWVDLVTSGNEARTRGQADLNTGTWRGLAEIATVENISGTAFADQLFGDASANILIGNAGTDALDGRSGNDTLSGGAGSDTLTGGMDHDELIGGEGDDILAGGLGGDVLTGGEGFDVATFASGFGKDIVTDFQAGAGSEDILEFSLSTFSGFDAILAAAAQGGSDIVVTVDASNTVTLRNVQLSTLHTDDFRFV
jgi:Ca2+-binding RTX toxin-like protein